jgi:hypothetical protein
MSINTATPQISNKRTGSMGESKMFVIRFFAEGHRALHPSRALHKAAGFFFSKPAKVNRLLFPIGQRMSRTLYVAIHRATILATKFGGDLA